MDIKLDDLAEGGSGVRAALSARLLGTGLTFTLINWALHDLNAPRQAATD